MEGPTGTEERPGRTAPEAAQGARRPKWTRGEAGDSEGQAGPETGSGQGAPARDWGRPRGRRALGGLWGRPARAEEEAHRGRQGLPAVWRGGGPNSPHGEPGGWVRGSRMESGWGWGGAAVLGIG